MSNDTAAAIDRAKLNELSREIANHERTLAEEMALLASLDYQTRIATGANGLWWFTVYAAGKPIITSKQGFNTKRGARVHARRALDDFTAKVRNRLQAHINVARN